MNDEIKTNEDYRRILVTANKLEAIQSNLESVIDFFLTPIVKLYSKLCNDCLKLLFECEFKLDQFRKAEELVWRRIYHDIYRFQKTKRLRVKRHDEFLMESHFISGIGFYSTLIIKLRSHYNIQDVPGVIIPLNLSLGPLDNFVDNQRLNDEEENSTKATDDDDRSVGIEGSSTSNNGIAKEWARQAIYRSLVYMGDLARYLLEISQFDYRKLAFEFYKSASRNQPDNGLPFNQLATLASGLNHNLDAICNYMRCCLRPKPFEGAEGNMKKIFDMNKKFFEEAVNKGGHFAKISDVLASKEPSVAAESMMRSIILTFIKLTSDIWTAISLGDDFDIELLKEEIVVETRIFFEGLREALELESVVPLSTSYIKEHEFCPISGGSSFAEKPKYVTATIMYEFVTISMLLIAKCQKEKRSHGKTTGVINDYVVDLANTLALNLLHYSTSKCQKVIMGKVQEFRVSHQKFNPGNKSMIAKHHQAPDKGFKNSGGNLSNSSQRSLDAVNSSSEATSRRAISRLRQRKAAINYSDNNNSPQNEDSDMSELEETALSTIDALEISSDMSEDAGRQMNDLIDLDSSNDEVSLETNTNQNRLPLPLGSFNNLSKPLLRPTRSQNYELERSLYSTNASNSLPVPDLLTGDIDERINYKAPATSQSPIESLSESEIRERSSPGLLGPNSLTETNGFQSTLTFIYSQTYLPTIKIFCDWLLSNSEMISLNLESFRSFCTELENLVSLLNDLLKMIRSKNAVWTDKADSVLNQGTSFNPEQCNNENEVFNHTFNGPTWIQKYPLSCDFPLLSLDPLKNVHELNIDFGYQRELSEPEAGFLTIQCIEAFFHALTAFLKNKSYT